MSKVAENLSRLPSGWPLIRLGDICMTTSGGTPSRKNLAYYEGKIPWVKSGELPDGPVLEIEEFVSEDAISNSSAKIFPSGTLLIAMYGATVGKLGVLNCDAATNQAICAIFPPENLNNKYLFWFLRAVRSDLVSQAVGGAQPNINQGILRDIQVPLAPLNEQIRIVAEIEKQFSRLDEAVSNLKRIKANLKRYKAAVLKAAVEGKLTEEWRRQHPDVEPADKLLERILAERRRAVGKGKYKEPVGPDTSGLPELPAGWVWASVEQLGNVQLGKMLDKQKHKSGKQLPYLRNINVRWGSVDTTDLLQMFFEEKELERFSLQSGDVLVCEGGEPGRAAIWNGTVAEMKYQKALHRVRFTIGYDPKLLVFQLEYLAKSGRLEQWFTGSTIKHFTRESFATLPLPLPSLSEQHQIVAEVERRLSIVAEAEAEVDNNLRRADRLRQSILKQAFSGQLVPQDPHDEPASVLLERIRIDVGARFIAPETESAKPKRAQSIAPLRKPEPVSAVSNDFPSLDAVLTAILGRMHPGKEYSRADLADPLGLSASRWNAAIQELKRRGQVRQVGEKRGARYMLI